MEDKDNIGGLVQERRNSSALAMELRLSYINPSILSCIVYTMLVPFDWQLYFMNDCQ